MENKFNKISGNIIDPKTKLQEYSLKKFKNYQFIKIFQIMDHLINQF